MLAALVVAASLQAAVDEPIELRLLRTVYVGAWQGTDSEQALALANDSQASYLGHVLSRSALNVMGEDRGFPEWPLERLLERTLDLLGPETHALTTPTLRDFSGDHAVYAVVHAMVTSGQTEEAERALSARLATSSRYDRAVSLQALRNIGTPEATAALRRFRESGDDSNLAENLLADQRFPFLFDLRDRLHLIPPEQRERRRLLEIASQGCGERPTLAVYFLGFLAAAAEDDREASELAELRRLAALPCFMTRYFAVRALALRSVETPSFWAERFAAEQDAWQRAQLARVGFSRLGTSFPATALEWLADEPSQYVQWELMHGNVERREGARFRTAWDLWDHPTLQMHLNFPTGGSEMQMADLEALIAWLESGRRPQNPFVHNHLLYGIARHTDGAATRRFLRLLAAREDLTRSFWILTPLQDVAALPLLLYWQTLDIAEASQRDALERIVVRLEGMGPRMTVDAACCRPTRECLDAWIQSRAPGFGSIGGADEARAWLDDSPPEDEKPAVTFLDDLSRVASVTRQEGETERWEHLFGCWRRVDDTDAQIR